MRFLIAAVSAAFSIALLSSAAAAAADVRITALDCESHPRRIRIENNGGEAVSLSGWQLQSDPAEGSPFDLGQAGSLAAGQKIYVFQGHLSPNADPSIGFYRWGSDDTFFLRANDSTDYVRIVDGQGNQIDQRNCEGVPATPSPDPTVETTPAPTSEPAAGGGSVPATPAPAKKAGAAVTRASADTASKLPGLGGPPPVDHAIPPTYELIAGAIVIALGLAFVSRGLRRDQADR